MPLATNAAGIALIKAAEGIRLASYQDPSGSWTIGYGHTVNVGPGQTITQAEADQLLAQDLMQFEAGVSSVTANPTSNEFSAMVSLAFNIGMGGFKGSTVLRQHNAGNYAAAADAFLLWNKAHVDGQLVELAGLTTRRAAERALYLTPDARLPPVPPPESIYTLTLGVDSSGNPFVSSLVKMTVAVLLMLGIGAFAG